MIAPTTGNLQVSRRESLESESEPLNESARYLIVRLYVCLKPMEPMATKRLGKNGAKRSLHITAPVVRHEGVVSKITGAETTSDNLIDIDYAGEFLILGTYPVPNVCPAAEAFEVFIKRFRRLWR